jgi:hypothetical protein
MTTEEGREGKTTRPEGKRKKKKKKKKGSLQLVEWQQRMVLQASRRRRLPPAIGLNSASWRPAAIIILQHLPFKNILYKSTVLVITRDHSENL